MTIEIGQPAPEFSLKDQHGRDVRLAEVRSERNVVLMFYPFAFSSVCTGELCELRDSLPGFENADTALLAVSCDPMFSLRAFSDHDGLNYPLLSDFWPHGKVSSEYGVFDASYGCALRGTFVIDRSGIVRWKVENAMGDARAMSDYSAALSNLPA